MIEDHLPGVSEITVSYGDSDDREYSGGNRACTSRGNDVTITFDTVDYTVIGDDGDIPEITLDALNAPLDPRTFKEDGDGSFLLAQLSKGVVELTGEAEEVRKGVRYEDRVARYFNGSGTDTLTFLYTVLAGDESPDLDASKFLVDGQSFRGGEWGQIYRVPETWTSQNATVNKLTHPDKDILITLANTWDFPTEGKVSFF